MRFRREDLRVESFEYVAVGPGLALLRLAGEWRAAAPAGARLLATPPDGAEEELAALPEPPGDGSPLWRAAFSADSALLGGHVRFRLEADDGRAVELPQPVERGVAPVAAEPAEPGAEPRAAAGPGAEPFAEPRAAAAAGPGAEPPVAAAGPGAEPFAGPVPEPEAPAARNGSAPDTHALDAERALQAERARHERAEASLREQLRVMVSETAEFMGRLEGYEMRRAELEKELSWERLLHKETRRLHDEAERERDEAIERLGPVESELARVRREVEASARAQRRLADARERIAELERQLERQETLLHSAREFADRGTSRLAELEQRLVDLREAAAAAPADSHAPAGPAVPPEQQELIERALDEADRGTERLAYLERRVGELREGIVAQAAAEPQQSGALRARRRFRR